MKKIFFISMVVILATVANAQFRLDMGVGYSSTGYATTELSAGYNFKPVFAQVGYLLHLTNKVEGGSIFYGKLGHRIEVGEWGFEPSLGYTYTLRSNDNKELNESGYTVSLYATKWIYPNAHLFGGISRISTAKMWIASFGIRFSLEYTTRD